MELNNKFKRNLQIGFGLSLLILVVSSALALVSIFHVKQKTAWVTHTNEVLRQTEKVISSIKDAETGQRGFLLSGSDTFLQPYQNAKVKVFLHIDTLQSLTSDNPMQQKKITELRTLIKARLNRLQELINTQKKGNLIDVQQLGVGKELMDATRSLVDEIQQEENNLLAQRSADLNFYSNLTPAVIILAAVIALVITWIFYRRVKKDFDARRLLQVQLEEKDREITHRIDVIEDIASQIALGNYKVRIDDNEKDALGRLSESLNQMAQSLDASFDDLMVRDWVKTGVANLSEQMVGETNFEQLCRSIIYFIAEYTHSATGALYIQHDDSLHLTAGYALPANNMGSKVQNGEGLAGQCAASKKEIVLSDIPQDNIFLKLAGGEARPRAVIAVPVFFEKELKGVIELSSLHEFTARETDFLHAVAYNIGTAVESAQRRAHLFELFQQTQAQAEELQAQHAELEQINTELEAQSQKLQVSEEELKVQQEELLQSNQELEERSTLLEEKNQLIIERNLDIQRKAEELEAATRYKSEFLANMSHELRTPLNSILLLSRLMAENNESNLSAEQVEYARVIQSSGNGLLTLIDEILDLSKIESGKMKLEFNPVTLEEIADDMKGIFAPMAKEKNLRFEIIIRENVPPQVVTDSQRLEQVLKNLLSNALKFTARGAVTMEVQPVNGTHVRFAVRDTGIGIPPDKQKLVFEAFQQADGSTRRKYGGTGLGLSICRELAKLLGGEITLNSEVGKGSTFAITIPVNGPEQQGEESTASQHYQPEKTAHPAVLPLPAKRPDTALPSLPAADMPAAIADDRDKIQPGDKVILIVEDDTNFAQTLLNFARRNGYKAVVSVRGDYGLPLAVQFKPMAILLDIVLPVKNGWQVMDELKSNLQTRHIPVHMMSSLPYKEESLNKGALDFISKPVAFEQLPGLFEKIEQALLRGPKKILIVEENAKHAQALTYFLSTYRLNTICTSDAEQAVQALQKEDVECVVLDMGVVNDKVYTALEDIKRDSGLEQLPVIVFTGKTLSKSEEQRLKQVADSIVVKTANSYKRILDEVALFLHIVEENIPDQQTRRNKVNALSEVLENKTVLIADDDVRNIYSLTKALEAHRMHVLSATDGKEALEVLNANPAINVVLMDMMMPEMDGYETTQAIRKIPQFRNLPVLAITAKAMYGDREKCIQAGASDYISKPVDVDQLVSLLRVWLYNKN